MRDSERELMRKRVTQHDPIVRTEHNLEKTDPIKMKTKRKTHTDRILNNLREILHGLGGLGFNEISFNLQQVSLTKVWKGTG